MNETTPARTAFSRAIIFSMILTIGNSHARAQYEVVLAKPVDVGALSGQVQDPIGGKIEGAHVDLLDFQTEQVLASTTTNTKGDFQFKDFGKNIYKLKIAMPGFNLLKVTIRIRKHSPALVVFRLLIAA